jgi:PAB1-binding protein PBP1
MAKAGCEGAKLLVGDAVTGAAKTAKTLIGRPSKSKSPAKKAAALKKAVTKKSPKNADKKSSTKAAKKKSTVRKRKRGLKETKHNAALEAENFAFRLFRIQHEE